VSRDFEWLNLVSINVGLEKLDCSGVEQVTGWIERHSATRWGAFFADLSAHARL